MIDHYLHSMKLLKELDRLAGDDDDAGQCRYLVLDEAYRMIDLRFEANLIKAVFILNFD